MAALALRNVTRVFGDAPARALEALRAGESKEAILAATGQVVGVRDVTLDIAAGGCFVVMGLSGSGKSTLIRHLNRLVEPSSGAILCDGENILDYDAEALRRFRRDRASMVFQHFALLPHRTVLDNVAYGLTLRARDRAARRAGLERARGWIARVGLTGYETRFPAELSGGMMQRVGLARALATDADVLLMDEAFSALDPLIRRDMQALLMRLQEELHRTIVFITHDLDEALRLGERIAIMRDGAIEQVGSGDEILRHPATPHVERFVEAVRGGRAGAPATLVLPEDAHPVEVTDGAGRVLGALDRRRILEALGRDARPGP